jgi:hypothetical protein
VKRLLLLIAALAVPMSMSVPAIAQGADRDVIHLEDAFFNGCTGEDVLVEADVVIITREVGDKSLFHITWKHATAVGAESGDRYIFQGEPSTFVGTENTFTAVDLLWLIAPGSTDNLQVHVNFHFTVVDGETVVEIDHVFAECRG